MTDVDWLSLGLFVWMMMVVITISQSNEALENIQEQLESNTCYEQIEEEM